MNDLAGDGLAGLDRFEARKVAVERLQELGALVEEKPYENNVGFSQRADVPIEPRLSEQWFLKYPEPCERSCAAQLLWREPGSDASFIRTLGEGLRPWMTNIQDWCISRQLWWGHRIPVWTNVDDQNEDGFRTRALQSESSGAGQLGFRELDIGP